MTFVKLKEYTTVYAEWEALLQHDPYVYGYKDFTFRSSANITRAEAAQMLYNASDRSGWEISNFTDVSQNDWFFNAVTSLCDDEIIFGYADDTFKPQNFITRAEFVAMVARCAQLEDLGDVEFNDVSSTHWASSAISMAMNSSLVSGYPDYTFNPDGYITRAEAVTIVNNLIGRTTAADDLPRMSMPFADVYKTNWAYYEIQKAAVAHTHE